MMNIQAHSGQSVVIELGQRELIVALTMIQEARDSFDCSNETGKSLVELFCSANALVEEARRKNQGRTLVHMKTRTPANSAQEK